MPHYISGFHKGVGTRRRGVRRRGVLTHTRNLGIIRLIPYHKAMTGRVAMLETLSEPGIVQARGVVGW